MKPLSLGLALLLSASAAWAEGSNAGQSSSDKMSAGSMKGKTALSSADKRFMTMAAQTDLAEIQVGNLALQKASSDSVKKIAQRLVDDHTKTSEAMKQIAEQKGMTLPTETDAKHKALATKLESESGADFDRDFLTANAADHHKVIAAFQREQTSTRDPELKDFTGKFLSAIQEHTEAIDQAKSSASSGAK